MINLKEKMKKFERINIYPVVTQKFCNGKKSLDILKELVDAGIKIVQLREKEMSKRELFNLGEQYRKITEDNDILLIIDDHIDIAMAVSADGVHLGQNDFPFEKVRDIDQHLIVGVSTHNLDEILQAQKFGISYINVGPIFPTKTKDVVSSSVGLENLKKWLPQITIPFTVMGGIKKNNLASLYELGVYRTAMVTEITQSSDIKKTIQEMRNLKREFR